MSARDEAWALVEDAEKRLGYQVKRRDDAARKLSKVTDLGMRAMMAELLVQAECNERDPKFQEQERERAKDKAQAELDWLLAMTRSALDGVFGPEAREAAREILVDDHGRERTDLASLRASRVPIRNASIRGGRRRYDARGERSEWRGKRAVNE